ncbi:MAG: hypothetical protein WC254_03750 [Candidatus Woesearchaeota archaeon]|jgi:chromosome segregation ATPase
MGFMQRDIDFKLILLIILVIIAIVGLTLFYQSSAGNIIRKYDKVSENLEKAQENLTVTQAKYGACVAKIDNLSLELNAATDYQLEAQDEFNNLYTETQSTLEETQTSLENTEEELASTESELTNVNEELDTCETTITANGDAADKAKTYGSSAESRLDGCKGCTDVSTCTSCINSALDEIIQVNNYLDQIEG